MKRMPMLSVLAALLWAGGMASAQVSPVQVRVHVGGGTDHQYTDYTYTRRGRLRHGQKITRTIRSKQLEVTLTNITGKPLAGVQAQLAVFGQAASSTEPEVMRFDEKTVSIAAVQPTNVKGGVVQFVEHEGGDRTDYVGYAVIIRQGEKELGAVFEPLRLKQFYKDALASRTKPESADQPNKKRAE